MVGDSDPVANGIKEWDKVRKAAEAALEEAKTARAEAEYYRGQCVLMTEQRKADEAHVRRLQQHCDEMVIMIDALGGAVLSVLEKRKAGFFRRAGSIADGADRIRAASAAGVDDLEANIAQLARVNTQQQPTTPPPLANGGQVE
jgi:hypothetical protein